MRKVIYLSAVLVSLVATSYAVAEGVGGAKNARAVAAEFTATNASKTTQQTCTSSDGKTIVVTQGVYTGSASGDPDLTGPITLRARSVVNTTDGVGVVDGRLTIDVASGRNTAANYSAVYDHGAVAGLATGRAHAPGARLVANLSAGFSSTGGFTGGKLGGTSGGSAVELTPGACKPSRTVHEKSQAHGTVSAISADSITVAGLTCAIPADKSGDVNAKVAKDDVVSIRCTLQNGTNTLTSVAKHGHEHGK